MVNNASSHKPVQSHTVEGSVLSIGQALYIVGSPDPRLTQQVNIDIHLQFQYCAYYKVYLSPQTGEIHTYPGPLSYHRNRSAYQQLLHTGNLKYDRPGFIFSPLLF